VAENPHPYEKRKGAAPSDWGTDAMEHYFYCPYCGEEISMVLDLSVRGQTYVEDCEVCCNPIEIRYAVEEENLSEFAAKVLE
jgi:transcription elongation factor Elf1